MTQPLDPTDARLLDLLQAEVPLVPRPWEVLGRRAGLAEGEVIRRVTALKAAHAERRGIIRQIGAIFDSKSLGYQSTLAAARIPAERLAAAVAVINGHPGVSHNYLRNHDYNLWYTLAVPPDSRLGLEGTLRILHRESGAAETRMLPTLRLFKIGVKLDLSGAEGEAGGDETPAPRYTQEQRDRASAAPLTASDKALIRILQQDLAIVAEPFAAWAQEAGLATGELLARAEEYRQRGLMRRFSAVLRHREAGFSANAMGVWAVPAEQAESFGQAAAGFSAVSHCYLRPTYPDWPFNIFTMVHAPTPADCEAVLAKIGAATGVREFRALYSTQEFKKVRVQYFTPAVAEWEAAHPI